MSRVWTVIGAAVLAGACSRGPQPASSAGTPAIPPPAAPMTAPIPTPSGTPAPSPAAPPATTQPADKEPSLEAVNEDADLPALPAVPFPAARPMPVVESIFHFAARHPEVLSHVPCFCGCQDRGHRNNDDCFVSARDARGRVTAWEPHGLG